MSDTLQGPSPSQGNDNIIAMVQLHVWEALILELTLMF